MSSSPQLLLPKFPGLNAQATALWRQFLRLYENRFINYAYNVRVGRGLDPGPSRTPAEREFWRKVTTKRADVVAQAGGDTWVFEIDPDPTLRTFGQLRGYKLLLPRFYNVTGQVVGAVISEHMGADMFALFHGDGDLVFKFPKFLPPNLPPQFLPTPTLPYQATAPKPSSFLPQR